MVNYNIYIAYVKDLVSKSEYKFFFELDALLNPYSLVYKIADDLGYDSNVQIKVERL